MRNLPNLICKARRQLSANETLESCEREISWLGPALFPLLQCAFRNL
jgi:hypothetical protein